MHRTRATDRDGDDVDVKEEMMDSFESGLEALEANATELWDEMPGEFGAQGETSEAGGRPIDEMQEMELGAELLEVTSEQELEQFLGKLVRRAASAAGGFISSPAAHALGGILKNAARQALPVVGGALGSAIGGAGGARMGSQLATSAGRLFGLELEGLSAEDKEYEVARRFVRFGGAAAANAARMRGAGGAAGARAAALAAARRHAPGLLRRRVRGRPVGGDMPDISVGDSSSGRWVRRGRNIIIVNCSPSTSAQTPDSASRVETPGATDGSEAVEAGG